MIVSLIVAMDERRGIGKDNQLPWHLASDLKRFKALTMGHHLIMGRKTFEAIGRPLPGRIMIIVSRMKSYAAQGCILAHSLEQAIKIAEGKLETEVFIIGGGEIFHQAIGLADKIYQTTVHTVVDADVFFPILEPSQWIRDHFSSQTKTNRDDYSSDFAILTRKLQKLP